MSCVWKVVPVIGNAIFSCVFPLSECRLACLFIVSASSAAFSVCSDLRCSFGFQNLELNYIQFSARRTLCPVMFYSNLYL